MELRDLSPKAEPVAWANVSALVVSSLIEYGVDIRNSLAQLIALVLPFLLANLWARFQVYAPDTVRDITNAQNALEDTTGKHPLPK